MFARNRHLIPLGLLAILMSLLIIACQGSPKHNPAAQSSAIGTDDCRIVKHDAGETQICGKPQKIAVLGPHMLDILLSLGEQPAGYAKSPVLGEGQPTSEIPVLGSRVTTEPMSLGLRNAPSLEAIVKLKPDLILGEEFLDPFYSNLSAIAPTLMFKGDGDDWKQSIQKIAQVFDREEEARAVIESHEQKLATVGAQLTPVAEAHTQILLLDARRLPVSFRAKDNVHFAGALIEGLGFQLVVPSDGYGWISSLEILPQLDADIIIAIAGIDEIENSKRIWNQNSLTQSLQATQENRVYWVDYHVWGSNMRGPISAEILIDEAKQLLLPLTESH